MPAPTSPAPEQVVVVGAGLAGLRTAAELRARGYTGHLTVVGAEPHLPYDRPPLSKQLLTHPGPVWLAQDLGADLTALADELLLGHVVEAVDATEDGARVTVRGPGGAVTRLGADVVVLACGSQPVRPPSWEHALVLHDLADAALLRERLVPGARVVVVGAGWIGAEVAGVAGGAGCAVTVLEAAEAPLSRELGSSVGTLTVPWYAAAGVDLRLATVVEEVTPAGARLREGTVVGADVVLAAVGARPATRWLAGTVPLTARGAVPVDRAGRVRGGPACLRAVGDCAEITLPGGTAVPGGHWDGALQHPAAVAAGLLGQDLPPAPAPYVFSTQLGHELALFGHVSPAAEVVVRGDPRGPEGWTALYVETAAGPGETTVPGPGETTVPGPGETTVPGPGETTVPGPAAGSPRHRVRQLAPSAAGTPGALDGSWRGRREPRLVAGLAVDRPRDVGALRKLLADGAQPRLDLDAALDPGVALRRSVLS